MIRKPTAPKGTPWHAISEEHWAKGYTHVGRLTGVTPGAVRAAHKRLMAGRTMKNRGRPVPISLLPTDKPGKVARFYGISISTAKRWLAAAGRSTT